MAGPSQTSVQISQSYSKQNSPSRMRALPRNNVSMHNTQMANSDPIIDDDVKFDDENYDYIIRVGEIFNYR